MANLIESIRSLKDLTDNLCDPVKTGTVCLNSSTAFAQECSKLKSTLSSLLDPNNKPCVEEVYTKVNNHVDVIRNLVVKTPTVNSFALSIFMKRYGKWVEELKDNEIAASLLGNNIKPQKKSEVTFNSLIGMVKEKGKLKQGLLYPYKYTGLYPKQPRGVLLYGPPGTGKSQLVKSLVNELKDRAVLFAPDPSSLKGKYEGQTEANIAALYNAATSYLNNPPKTNDDGSIAKKPDFAIIFIDEADALFGAGREEDASKQRTVNTFLQFMDGFASDKRVITIAATNFPQVLDTAILRRLTLKIRVDLPSYEARHELLKQRIADRYSISKALQNKKNELMKKQEEITNDRVKLEQQITQEIMKNQEEITNDRVKLEQQITQEIKKLKEVELKKLKETELKKIKEKEEQEIKKIKDKQEEELKKIEEKEEQELKKLKEEVTALETERQREKHYLSRIEKTECEPKLVKGIFSNELVIDYCGITAKDVQMIARQTGPANTEASQKALEGRPDIEFAETLTTNVIIKVSEVGYSLADLNSALDESFNIASLRAIQGDAKFEEKGGYYIYDPSGGKKKLKAGDKPTVTFNEIKESDKHKIIAFDLRLEDMTKAFANTRASLRLDEYQAILDWENSS